MGSKLLSFRLLLLLSTRRPEHLLIKCSKCAIVFTCEFLMRKSLVWHKINVRVLHLIRITKRMFIVIQLVKWIFTLYNRLNTHKETTR